MKEKIYEIRIERPLSTSRRQAIDKFLDENASRVKWPTSYQWDEANAQLLRITVFPVRWEIWFAPKRITVYGSGPLWAKMLFSEKKKAMLREGLVYVLKDLGFMKVSGKMATKRDLVPVTLKRAVARSIFTHITIACAKFGLSGLTSIR